MKIIKIGISLYFFIVLFNNNLWSQQNTTCPPNIDFESGNLNNWRPFTGTCCPINTGTAGASTGRHTIMSGTGTDPYGGFPVVPSGGGSYSLRIGNSSTGRQAEKVRYFVRVPNNVNNYSFIYRYAVVFQDPGHTAAQQPRFEVKTFDSATNQSINCNTHTYIAASNIPGFTRSRVSSNVYYRAWSTATINLSGYAGRTIILDFASGDCSLSGHFGYGYVDLSCGLFQINTVACKKQKTSTLTAPPGFQSYRWLDSSKTQVLGTSSTLIVNTPSSLKKYYVVLTPFQGFGCPDTLSTQITVTNVNADFSIEPSKNICFKGNSYSFKNNSTTNSTPMSYAWSFGDGQTSTLTSPNKSYNTADSFNIRLITSSAEGCKDTLTKGLRILPTPVVKFNINDSAQCIKNHSFKFTNTSTINSGSMTYNWTFSDTSSSTSISPSKSFNTFGNYTVKLKVTSDKNCTDSITKNVSVYAMPISRFSVNDSDQCVKNHLFRFTNNSTIPTGTNTFNWNFGDNTSSTNTAPTKAYDSANNFLVTLIASSNNNCKDTSSKSVVTYAQPMAKFNINDSLQCFRSHLFAFTNTSAIRRGSMTYNWNFGDTTFNNTTNTNKAYAKFGNYAVKLKVTSDKNCTDSITKNVTVYAMPISRFSVNDSDQCIKNHLFSFTNNSSILSGTNTFNWNFGDNTFSTNSAPTKAYDSANNFLVTLIASSNNNCKDTSSKSVITYAQPVAKFNINDSLQCFRSHQFAFTNKSAIRRGNMTYNWNFGDTSFSTNVNPNKAYAKFGNYAVKLKVTSDKNCTDSITKNVSVYAMPISRFSVNDSDQCIKNHLFSFTNNSTIPTGTNSFNWNFGDNTSSTNSAPTKAYDSANNFLVTLIASSNNNCKDTSSKPVVTYAQPVAKFNINDSDQCFRSHQFSFTNKSVIRRGNMTYNWSFGDTTFNTNVNPNKAYAKFGNYAVKLKVTSDKNCTDSITKNVSVYAMPISRFSVNDSDQCIKNHLFSFTNNSTIPTGTNTFNWNFGDNTSSTNSAPTKAYDSANTFVVTLIASSNNNCKDTSSKSVVTYAQPMAKFNINDSLQCFRSHLFAFTNTSAIRRGSMTYNWNFGDTTFSNITNTNKAYAKFGNYAVKLKVTSDKNCTDSITKNVSVYAMPISRFSVNDSDQCIKNHLFRFTNNSTIPTGTNTFNWNFGDNTSSTNSAPTKAYDSANNFLVTLIASSNNNCKDTSSKPVVTYAQPVAKFNINDSLQCFRGHQFSFTNTSAIRRGNMTYNWNFGDTTFSNITNTNKAYAKFGNYAVKLKATSDKNCTDSITKNVSVYAMPISRFSVNDSDQCIKNHLFNFTNNSTIPTGTNSFNWNFGDNTSSTNSAPTKAYDSANNFLVTLIASSNNNCKDTSSKPVVTYAQPVAKFNINDSAQCFRGHQFSFTNTSAIRRGNMTYNWNFGDTTFNTNVNPNKAYAKFGNYAVKLKVTSDKNCTDSIIKNVTVYAMPISRFSVNDSDQCVKNHLFSFTNNSTIPTGTNSFNWNFGDNTSSTNSAPTKAYDSANNFLVTLIASSNNNCKDTSSKPVVTYAQPVAKFNINDSLQCFRSHQFAFTNKSVIRRGNMTYNWNFGDTTFSNITNTNKAYAKFGNYAVKLKATSDKNCTDSIIKNVSVYAMPISRFSVNDSDQCVKNHLFSFTNNSTIPTGTNTFNWNFGDNTSSTNSAPTKVYDSANNFLVTLIASSNNNCKDTSSKSVVTYAQPVAKFNINDSLQCFRSHQFAFTNNSSNFDIPSYFWHYGNGDTSNQRNPNYIYDTNGVFRVSLTIETQFGCKDSSIQFVEIYPMPLANFTINDTGQCLVNNQFVFTNNSSIAYNKMNYSWDLNDGTKGTLDTIKHTYLNDGKYTIQLVANSENGCLDTIMKKVAVYPMPIAKFELSDTAMCELGNNFNYKNLSAILYDTLNYNWEFGDGNFSDLKSPNHSYLNEGIYNIHLLVTSEMGCIDSTKSKIEIHPMPIAKFNTNDTDQCLGSNLFSITNESFISKGNVSYNWNLGDGTSSNLLNLTHQYKVFGDYLVTLITTSNKNCKDTSNQTIKVYSHPTIKYKLNNKESCLKNNKFILEDITIHTSNTKNWDWIFYKANSGLDLTFNTSNVELQFNKIGKYFYQLILTDSNICSDTINDYLQVLPQSKLDFYSDTVCIGEENTFTSNCSVDTGSITELKWDFGDGSSDINTNTTHRYTSPGNYNITLTSNNSFNCKDTLTKPNSAQSRDIPIVSFTYDKTLDSLTYTGYKFQSTSIGLSKLDHFWTFNNNQNSTDINPYILFSDSGMKWIELEVEDQFGCKNQTGKWIKASPEMLVYIPNSFSPNEDGINDLFKPYGVVYPKEYEWIVLDRWGGVIYKSNNYLEGWNGKIKDKLVPDGVYAYVLKVTTAQNKKLRFGGTFHIIY